MSHNANTPYYTYAGIALTLLIFFFIPISGLIKKKETSDAELMAARYSAITGKQVKEVKASSNSRVRIIFNDGSYIDTSAYALRNYSLLHINEPPKSN